jgi:hypothetical protein
MIIFKSGDLCPNSFIASNFNQNPFRLYAPFAGMEKSEFWRLEFCPSVVFQNSEEKLVTHSNSFSCHGLDHGILTEVEGLVRLTSSY